LLKHSRKFGIKWENLPKMIDMQSIRMIFPTEGKHVKLRMFTQEHISDTYLSWLNDPDVVRYSNQRFYCHSHQSSSAYLKTFDFSDAILLAIHLTGTEKYIGTMSVYFSVVHQTADIGMLIGEKSCWGQGIGQDAWSTMLNLLLYTAKVRKITGGTLRSNSAMARIMTKSGMSSDGVRSCQEIFENKPEDIIYFAKFC
jgi:ribosomal-protein-alanine N-acetyltransferase